ncbi:MAG: hypothetical protein UU93_C0034G0006 [Candidatus Amesbacteria bacterium GW2011_GWA2_42_12]|uniref:Uncharacterized protein n=1 Tax=Candidatus Amesbacteria bacterium GW2011_GWA2_42_12 TaxID=1618356 RepID=A0A0G0Y1D8_9BACT|nr:MAG: hypothetical protein UU93_C0034G0006 [Candidatus Amesbacteria bacterium GW2011_GWA2_42_12]
MSSETSNVLLSAEKARSLAQRIFSQYPHTTESLQWLENNSELAKVARDHIPSLPEAELETTNQSTHNSPGLRAFFQAKREFGWADDEFDPEKPAKSAMGIFLEGYGRYVALRLSKEPDQIAKIQKAFVYAFEAILLVEHPESKLLGDIKEWMIADADKFSEPIQQLLKPSAP